MKLPLIILLIATAKLTIAQIDLTQLDGMISDSESAQFQKLGENDQSEIYISVNDDNLKINVRSDTMYVASLCICVNERNTLVFHASAALGLIRYTTADGSQWNSNERFEWKMREGDLSEETIQLRQDHLEEYGWVANTLGMGSRREAEFIIDKSILDGEYAYLAAGLMPKADPENIIGLPAETSGDCADFKLVAGPPENQYEFRPENWFKIKL